MKFINKYLAQYSLISLIATALTYFVILVVNKNGSNQMTLFLYLSTMTISAYRLGVKDDYRKFLGLNYHLVAYLAYNSIPLLLLLLNVVPDDNIDYLQNVIIGWGALLFVHFAVWLVVKFSHYNNKELCK